MQIIYYWYQSKYNLFKNIYSENESKYVNPTKDQVESSSPDIRPNIKINIQEEILIEENEVPPIVPARHKIINE